jgi:hypothetical protein
LDAKECSVNTDGKARRRAGSRRPIQDWEVEYLEQLGRELRRLREHTTLSIVDYAWECEISVPHVRRLELGLRRTRPSTLRRIATVIEAECPDEGTADEILARLLRLGGGAIAEESQYEARLDRRRARRRRKAAKIRFAHWQDNHDDELTAVGPEEPTEPPWWLPVVDLEATVNAGPTWLDLVGESSE